MRDMIIFEIDKNLYALNLEHIQRIIQVPALTIIPDGHPFIDGMMSYVTPSVDCISKELEYSGGYIIDHPWINLYTKGSFQELHDHFSWDLACVLFINDGENFSKFYVKDRNNVNTSENLQDILHKVNGYTSGHFVDIKEGDMIVFPANMLHGVTVHNSDIVRKTFSFNLNFTK